MLRSANLLLHSYWNGQLMVSLYRGFPPPYHLNVKPPSSHPKRADQQHDVPWKHPKWGGTKSTWQPFGKRVVHQWWMHKKATRCPSKVPPLNRYVAVWNDSFALADGRIHGKGEIPVLNLTPSVTCLCSWIVLLGQLNEVVIIEHKY